MGWAKAASWPARSPPPSPPSASQPSFSIPALLLTNSGETEELLAILPHLRRRGTARIALEGRINSSLVGHCDVVLDASVDREICPLNLAPTASTAVAMAIGDALAAV